MQEMRDRARANLPMVLLTLLSIVQALALEFLWTYVRENPGLFAMTWVNLLTWVQLAASLLGLILIWIVYASHAMRLRWVPTTTDSVYPFVIGLMEFILIELLGPDRIGPWLICYAAIFALMVGISHRTMRRARLDGQNDKFFERLAPAQPKDFYSPVVTISIITAAGIYVTVAENKGIFALLAMLFTTIAALYQFRIAALLWERSLSDTWEQD